MTANSARWRTTMTVLVVLLANKISLSDALGKYNPCSAPGLVTSVCLCIHRLIYDSRSCLH